MALPDGGKSFMLYGTISTQHPSLTDRRMDRNPISILSERLI